MSKASRRLDTPKQQFGRLLVALDLRQPTPQSNRIFVSYRTDDAPAREELERGVTQRWKERWSFKAVAQDGREDESASTETSWRDECEALIKDSVAVVCLVGNTTAESQNIEWEIQTAIASQKPILAIRIGSDPKPVTALERAGIDPFTGGVDEAARLFQDLLVDAALFRFGPPAQVLDLTLIEQYKLILQTSESLQNRRQAFHVFFMSINSLFLGAIGLVTRESLVSSGWLAAPALALAIFGFFLCGSWRRQINSYGHVNTSKFDVINRIEAKLPVAPFVAEYIALLQRDWESFTKAERRIPTVFRYIYVLAALTAAGILVASVF